MRKVLIIAVLGIALSSCKKKCDAPTGKCAESNITNEACLAQFQSWFYNEQSHKCELLSYSGCSPKGFETEQDCGQCLCNKK